MGTRHMIGVVKDGAWKVGQYGQWDGYPEGQGFRVLDLLRNGGIEKIRKNIDKCYFVTRTDVRSFYVEAGDSPDNKSGFVSDEVAQKVFKAHPTLSRDVGADILKYIIDCEEDKKVELFDQHEFIEDEVFCEFAYVINLDTNDLICYAGKNNIFAEYNIDDLPSNEKMLSDYKSYCENNEE